MVDFLCWNIVAIYDKLWYCHTGATDKRQAGGSPTRFAEGKRLFAPSDRKKGGQWIMVTYSDMFQFCMLIVAVISLVVKVCNSKKK